MVRKAVLEPPLLIQAGRRINGVGGQAPPPPVGRRPRDLLASTFPDEYRIIGGSQDLLEFQDPLPRRRGEGQLGMVIKGDEVDLGRKPFRSRASCRAWAGESLRSRNIT